MSTDPLLAQFVFFTQTGEKHGLPASNILFPFRQIWLFVFVIVLIKIRLVLFSNLLTSCW